MVNYFEMMVEVFVLVRVVYGIGEEVVVLEDIKG